MGREQHKSAKDLLKKEIDNKTTRLVSFRQELEVLENKVSLLKRQMEKECEEIDDLVNTVLALETPIDEATKKAAP